ncbi:LCP family protein [Candidatus Saccharibacteria bacterium]|nr:LCP family protein [Candidatus Saccharibacteria bacterium]
MVEDNQQTKKNRLYWRVFGAVLVVLQAISSAILIISLLHTNIFSLLVVSLIIFGLVALLLFNIYKLVIKKETYILTRIICTFIAVACIALSVFALRYTGAINGFLNKITETKPETKEYSVIVKNDSGIKSVSNLNNKSIGLLESDPKSVDAEQHLSGIAKIKSDYYSDVDTLIGVLDAAITDAIVLESDRYVAISEELDGLTKDLEVIYTFEIELGDTNLTPSSKEVTSEPFIIYISGSDSRVGIKATARSDVNILAVVNPKVGKILLVSIPRDTYVQLHDTVGLKDKLTHAGIYGISMSKATIEDFLNVKIDHTIKVGFEAVVKVVDELGGIDIVSDQAMRLSASSANGKKTCEYIEGKQHVDGDCVLRFARERKSYERGDRHRGENQQQVIANIIERLTSSKDYLLKAPAILDAAADLFETSFERDDITAFIRMQLANSTKWKVESISVDGTGTMLPTYSMGANRPLYVMIPNDESVASATNRINQYLEEELIETEAEQDNE